ncbi:AraC family transcriptional regulator [Agrobacterium tumefaciens]|uniref:AraC family transcriptional regulator, transcriptional activator of pobA n=1 Tax=Agrobacterium tumefaciens TaxID=358 RepID=A0A2L2LM45_AGRTU|nr:AraC family transcriptional regulator [Agrobacterium tumefaciens]AVH45399.1 AraC family transcriptional regulator, transcriptional activator of pobA [Agrobacterium tumefaciens]NSY99128.1 helix-turn-helix domain-containing protein [Agrobacterium tumefaciens]
MDGPRIDREQYVLGDASHHVGLLNCERISERSHIHGWHVHTHYHDGLAQLFYFADGETLGHLDYEEMRITAPALIWMPQLVNHGFDYPEGICGWVVTIPTADLMRISQTMPWIDPWLSRPAHIFGPEHLAGLLPFHSLFEEIEAEHAHWGEDRGVTLEALFRIALVRLHRCLQNALPSRATALVPHQTLVNEFRALVDRDYFLNRSVGDYAAELSVTSTYLTRCVRLATGRTAGAIIHDRLLLEARRLIVFTDLPIAQVAYRLNFSTPSYFTRFFTALAGEKPTVFRNRMRARNRQR